MPIDRVRAALPYMKSRGECIVELNKNIVANRTPERSSEWTTENLKTTRPNKQNNRTSGGGENNGTSLTGWYYKMNKK